MITPITPWIDALCKKAGTGSLQSHHFLAQGAGNQIFSVTTDRCEFVLKIAHPNPSQRLKIEADFLKATQGAWGPRFIFFDETGELHSQPLLLMERVTGIHVFDLNSDQADQLGKVLRRLHDYPTSLFLGLLEKPNRIDFISDRVLPQLQSAEKYLPLSRWNEFLKIIELVRNQGSSLSSKGENQNYGLVHTDIIPLNVIFKPSNHPVLIDWEWMRLDSPEWDLVSVLKAFPMQETLLESFWKGYGNQPSTQTLEWIGLLYHLNVIAWRLRSYYELGHYREESKKFLADLEQEWQWVQKRVS
jgi:thiamine kinase-like enzyme